MAAPDFSWWYDDSELSSELDTSSDEEVEPEPTPTVTKVSELKSTKTTRPSTQQATKQSRDRIAAKSLPYLKSPRTTTYSFSSLHEMMTSGTINLDPEYQRAVVWTTQKQESLIDSLYHNFYVPPIIFATTTREDGIEIRTCIDGKQRLTSMRLFMDGELSHKDSLKGKRSWFCNPAGSKRRLISPVWQSKFRTTQIACVEYDGITEEQQREIFQRVQMGVTLTPAERLQSANGPIADLIRGVRVRINSTEIFKGYLDWGKVRGKDFKALAEIAYLITHAKTAKSEPTIQRLEAFLDNKTHPVSVAKRREELAAILQPVMPNVMDIFCRIFQHPELGEPLRKNLSPLEFVMSAYLIFLYRKKLSDTQLSHAIAKMRREAEHSFKDMKFDTTKCKYLLTYIHKTMVGLIPGLNSDGFGDLPAIQGPCQRIESKIGGRSRVDDKPEVKRRQSSSIDIGPPPKKPRTLPSQPSLNTILVSTPVSKAKTTIKRTPVKQQTTSSQTTDVKKSAQARSIRANKSESLQIATPSVIPPPSMRTLPSGPSQQVITKLGAHFYEPIPLGRRAGVASNKSSPVIETQVAPSTPQVTGGTSNNSARMQEFGPIRPDRLVPVRSEKAAVSSRLTSEMSPTDARRSPTTPVEPRKTSSTTVDDWQTAFASLLPTHSRTTRVESDTA